MKKIDEKEFIWVEKYRPQCVDDLVITEELRNQINHWVQVDKQIPNLGFYSTQPGTGKSSISRAIINDLDADSLFINTSKDNGIDVVRENLTSFVSCISFEGAPKIAIFDEFCGSSPAFQGAAKSFIEEFSKNSRFIFTANTISKINKPILDRFIKYDFDAMYATNQRELLKQIYDRCCYILENEDVEYDKEDLKPLILSLYPAVRDIVMSLQEATKTVNGKKVLKIHDLDKSSTEVYRKMINALKEKDQKTMIEAVKMINNPEAFYKFFYKNAHKYFKPQSIGMAVIMCHSFINDGTIARDPEISLMAFGYQAMESKLEFV